MTNLKKQRRMASKILKVGENRIWMDSDAQDEIADAVTYEDIRELINDAVIGSKREHRKKKKEARKRRGAGSIKGARGARMCKKEQWIRKIRAQRGELKKLRDEGKIDRETYRETYLRAKGGEFRSVRHLISYLKSKNLIESV